MNDTAGGSLAVDNDIDGPALFITSGGSIALANVQGDVALQTSGGSVKIDNVGGNASVMTSGGHVVVTAPKTLRAII